MCEGKADDSNSRTDFDSAWKAILGQFFFDFLEFFFPDVGQDVDKGVAAEFLDSDLLALLPGNETGYRRADRVVRVQRVSGESAILFVHVEVQAGHDNEFAERMYIYNTRLFERFEQPVVSLAVLIDGSSSWRPSVYVRECYGCRLEFRFCVVKLLDFKNFSETPEMRRNPFSIVTLATLGSRPKKGSILRRRDLQLRLMRRLYEQEWSREDIKSLMRFLLWVLELPHEVEREVMRTVCEWEKAMGREFMPRYEREVLEKGVQQGMQQGMQQGGRKRQQEMLSKLLRTRFPSDTPDSLTLDLSSIPEELVESFFTCVLESKSVAEVQAWLDAHRDQLSRDDSEV